MRPNDHYAVVPLYGIAQSFLLTTQIIPSSAGYRSWREFDASFFLALPNF